MKTACTVLRHTLAAALIVVGLLVLLAEVEDHDLRRDELAMKNDVSNWRK